MAKIVLLATCIALAGCSTVHGTAGHDRQAAAAQRLPGYPASSYTSLGVIVVDYARPDSGTPTLADAMETLKSKVANAGGNAFIVREQVLGSGPGNARFITVSAEALHVR